MATPLPPTDLTSPWAESESQLRLKLAPSAGDQVVVHAAGELDMATAPLLLAELDALAGSGAWHVDLDLREVRFCDGSGLAFLLEGRRRIAARGGTLTVHDPCPSLRRILDICDLTMNLEEADSTGTRQDPPPRPLTSRARSR